MVGRKGEQKRGGKEQQIKPRWIMGISAKKNPKQNGGHHGVGQRMMGAHPGGPYQEWRQSLSSFIKEIDYWKEKTTTENTDYKW